MGLFCCGWRFLDFGCLVIGCLYFWFELFVLVFLIGCWLVGNEFCFVWIKSGCFGVALVYFDVFELSVML